MRLMRALPLALCCAATACQTEEQQQDQLEAVSPEAQESVASVVAAQEIRAQFQPVGNSGISGSVQVMPSGELTRLSIDLTGGTGAGVHQGHVHQGTCASPGSVVAPLNPVATDAQGRGSVGASLDIPAMTLLDGQHIVVYHQAGGSPGAPVACAVLPRTGGSV